MSGAVPLLIVLAAAGCGASEPTAEDFCPSTLTLSVTGGTTPTFDWLPACPVRVLRVSGSGSGTFWEVRATAEVYPPAAIWPPVEYGVIPTYGTSGTVTAIETQFPRTLVAGTTYELTLMAASVTGGAPIIVRQFTP